MNSARANSASTTEPMSTSEPNNSSTEAPEPSVADKAKAKAVNEGDFLQKQADEAKAAITAALADAKAALAEGLDPREWTRRYPLVAVGSAVAAGFVAAVMAIPSKEQQELKKLEKIRRALHPEVEETKQSATQAAKDVKEAAKEATKPSFWHTILREALQMIRPVLMSAVTASIAGHAASDGKQPSKPQDAGSVR